jgi:hypothetical protein
MYRWPYNPLSRSGSRAMAIQTSRPLEIVTLRRLYTEPYPLLREPRNRVRAVQSTVNKRAGLADNTLSFQQAR